jgi:hypothetical protein
LHKIRRSRNQMIFPVDHSIHVNEITRFHCKGYCHVWQSRVTEQKPCRRRPREGDQSEDRPIVTKKDGKTHKRAHLERLARVNRNANCPACKKSTRKVSSVIHHDMSFGHTANTADP